MKTIIGTVKELKGDYFAQDSAGNIIKLQVGDKITNDMLVYGAENNAKNAEIKIAMMNMGDVFSLSGMQKQAFDPSLTDIDTIDDAISPKSLNKALLTEAYDENIYSDEETSVDKEDDTFNDETEAGEERVVGQSTDDVFLARDGDSVDIVSTLRNARFSLGNLASGENEIFSSQLESLSTTGVSTPPSATPDYLLAQFTDNFVSGVTYTTSSGLSGLTGDSGVAGEFKYKDGDTITFTVGDVVVAEFSADVIQGDILFIQDIAGEALSESNAMYVENMAIFLQALDADLQDTTPDDGVLQTNALVNNAQSYSTNITITEEIREAFTGYIDPTTGKALNIAESGKQMISDALAHVNIEFTRDTERDEENFENVFETVAMEHVADTIQELAGERAPESAQEREADIIEVPGSVIKYNYLTDVTGNATISFSTDDLLVGAVGQQVITENLLVKNVVLGAGYESIGTLVNDGNGQYHIELNDDVTPYDLEGLTIDYRVEDWTVYRDVTSTTLDTYKSHLSATVENVPEDAQYNQFTLNSSLVFSEDQSLTIKFSPETSGIDFAEYSDDFTVPLEYSNDGGVTWKSMEVVGNYMRDDYDKPLPIFGFELEAGSESVEIRVPIFDDPYEESDIEVIDMLIEGENFYAENLQPGIIDNDPIVEVDFAIVSEDDGEAVITISLVDANKNPITSGENITVTYQTADLSAKAGEDYTPITGTITIPAGQNSVTVAVPIIDDTIIEETEFLSLELTSVSSNAVLGDPEASIRIYDNDVIKVTGETNEEGERVVFKVDVSDYVPSNAILKLHPTNSGATATQDLDYDSTTLRAYYVDASGEHTLVTDANSGFSLPEGVSEFFVSYESIDDTLLENPESVKMQVSASFEDGSGESVQKIGLGTATIVEKTPSISVSAASAQEGEYEVFTVSLSNQSTQ
ncbi:MAG: hypothetical protein JXQ67_02810, partial [Campylobacterales bacterium]|nr:hypothetical protein [Campylobacterales bacterium]